MRGAWERRGGSSVGAGIIQALVATINDDRALGTSSTFGEIIFRLHDTIHWIVINECIMDVGN